MAYHGLGSIPDFDAMTVEERDWNLHKLTEVKEEEKRKNDEAARQARSKTQGLRR